MIAGFGYQIARIKKSRCAIQIDIFAALAFIHCRQTGSKINLPCLCRGGNFRCFPGSAVFHQHGTDQNVSLLAVRIFDFALGRGVNNHRQCAGGFICQSDPVEIKIAHIRPQGDGINDRIFIHNTGFAHCLTINNFIRCGCCLGIINRLISIQPRNIRENKFIQRDRLIINCLLGFPF